MDLEDAVIENVLGWWWWCGSGFEVVVKVKW